MANNKIRNSGEDLEKFVKLVEDILLPKGFTVTPRQKVFDEEGNQIAELDLLISGNLSTTQINWLIECRDRPSQGVAPISWIEQLVGRRDRLKLDKVTAVSTTGFAPGAIDYARDKRIELRAIQEITREEMEGWILDESMTVREVWDELKNVDINLVKTNTIEEIKDEVIKEMQELNEITFIHTGTNEKISLRDIWQRVMKDFAIGDKIEPDADPTKTTVTVEFPNPADRFKFVLQNEDIHVDKMVFTADIRTKISTVPISKITKYAKVADSRTIAQSVHFELNIEERNVSVSLHKIDNESGSIISITKAEN